MKKGPLGFLPIPLPLPGYRPMGRRTVAGVRLEGPSSDMGAYSWKPDDKRRVDFLFENRRKSYGAPEPGWWAIAFDGDNPEGATEAELDTQEFPTLEAAVRWAKRFQPRRRTK